MALTMLEKAAEKKDKSPWPADIAAEFAREAKNPNPCVGSDAAVGNRAHARLDHPPRPRRAHRLPPPRARLFLDLVRGRGRQHVHDGTTVEYTYQPGETRHETYGKGEFKVHDLENLGDKEMVFMTVEFKDSANQPMPLPAGVRPQARPERRSSPVRARRRRACGCFVP